MIRNNFEAKKSLDETQTFIVRGTYESADPTTGAGIDIEWEEISIGFFVNGIWIETDMLPFISAMDNETFDIDSIHGFIDKICLDEIEGRKSQEMICGKLRRDYDLNDAE